MAQPLVGVLAKIARAQEHYYSLKEESVIIHLTKAPTSYIFQV